VEQIVNHNSISISGNEFEYLNCTEILLPVSVYPSHGSCYIKLNFTASNYNRACAHGWRARSQADNTDCPLSRSLPNTLRVFFTQNQQKIWNTCFMKQRVTASSAGRTFFVCRIRPIPRCEHIPCVVKPTAPNLYRIADGLADRRYSPARACSIPRRP